MSSIHHYLHDKTDIILSKKDGFTVLYMNVSLTTKGPESNVISTVAHSGAFSWHNIFF